MEGGTLFNSGFLGAHFNWWLGQIADDSTWRDNISSSNFEGTGNVPGWGRRYKVRIIGLHDKEEESIPSDQLPWAHIMYPVTAGGGQASSAQTANLRQGNFVFGFFLDGADQQVPVIMGVLGNNAQTKLNKNIGNTSNNFGPTSGHSQSTNGETDPNIKAPDHGLSTTSSPNATIEHPDNPHQQSVRNVKLQEIYDEKISLLSPCDLPGSALKAIQTELENLVNKINKYLNAAQSYVDAATNVIGQIQALIADFACTIAKYVKILFDKLMEFILKALNKALAPTVQNLPPNKRNLYSEIKEIIIELIHCIFNAIIDGLCGQIESYLNDNLNTENLPPDQQDPYIQTAPNCTAEQLVSSLVCQNMNSINSGLQDALNEVNSFLSGIAQDLQTLGAGISSISSVVNGISGSITAALQFTNISLSVFGCDLSPKCPVSNFYKFQDGGSTSSGTFNVANIDNLTTGCATTTSFSPLSTSNIQVSYASTTGALVSNVSVADANTYATNHPGTQFIFVNGDGQTQNLSISQVNALTTNDLLPTQNCVGLQTVNNCSNPPSVQISGGGGTGATANAVVGTDGAVLAADVVSGGTGYTSTPQVNIVDSCNIGSGAAATTGIGTTGGISNITITDPGNSYSYPNAGIGTTTTGGGISVSPGIGTTSAVIGGGLSGVGTGGGVGPGGGEGAGVGAGGTVGGGAAGGGAGITTTIIGAPISGGYPVTIQLTGLNITNPGLGYTNGDQLVISPSNGTTVSFTTNQFGSVTGLNVINPGIGFTGYPRIYMKTKTGINFSATPAFTVIRDPLAIPGVTPDKILQVTDLVGLKQTGYVNGRAYYGAVYYENGVRYAGYYKTAGTPIQVYDTLYESITGVVTTQPSAVQKSGTDVNSNNPTLNIPRTP